MTTKTFTISDDGEYIQTMNGTVAKHERFGSDLTTAMQAHQTLRQPKYGEELVGVQYLDENGNVTDEAVIGLTTVDEHNRTLRTTVPEDSNLLAIDRREQFLRGRLAEINNPDGSPRLDPAGRDIYAQERSKLEAELVLLNFQRQYEAALQQHRAQQEQMRKELQELDTEIERNLLEQRETQALLAARRRQFGIKDDV